MRNTTFIALHLLSLSLAGWLLARMVLHSDPKVPANVMVVLFLLFLLSGTLTSLLSWALLRYLAGSAAPQMALRHGLWGGLFLISLPILRWLGILSVLVVGALLLIFFGLESLLLLQQQQEAGEEVRQDG